MTSRARRSFLGLLLVAAVAPWAHAGKEENSIEVWKGPSCGCCQDWVEHLRAHGFVVRSVDTGNAEIREKLGMPLEFGSCHTARIGGYVLEGHVPAREIRRLLQERPAAIGLAVPAMPVGSPGMDGPAYGGRKDPYEVLLIKRDGRAAVYQSYR